MNPPPQWLPPDWVIRAFESIGFSCTKRRWAYVFRRGDIIFVFPALMAGFDVFFLFRNAKVHGIDRELWNALIAEEDGGTGGDEPPPAA